MKITHFREKINLSLLRKATIGNCMLEGRRKRCLVIPIEDALLQEDEEGVWLDVAGIRLQGNPFEQTHIIKQQLKKDVLDSMSIEQRKALPVLGGVTPFNPRKDFYPAKVEEIELVIRTASEEEGGLEF